MGKPLAQQSSSLTGWEKVIWAWWLFRHPKQARIEACDALSTLHQQDSSELRVVVVRRYSNTIYIPRGTSWALYWTQALSLGVLLLPNSPLDRLHLCQPTSFQWISGAATMQGGRSGFDDIPPSPWVPMGYVRGGTLSFQTHLPVNPPASSCFSSGRVHPDWGGLDQSPCLYPDKRWVRLSSSQYPNRRVRVSPFS